MNFSRKTILVVGAALLAACGDKVTVQEYTPPTPTAKVNFVEVTPATATVNTGASITFTAAVNADAGVATTVTWSASAGTVTSAGVFTAPSTANPGISVCATSTVDTGKKGCASVVVSAPPATFPATVSIASITTGALNVPVNPAAVAGQIDVTLNINPGTQTISKVELLLGGIVAYTQNFTAAQSAALRFAADEAIAAQTTFPQVIASINTACYQGGGSATCDGYVATDADGAPVWLNGARTLQAKIYTTTSGTSQAASASVSQNLVLANVDGFHVTTSGGTSAVDATGYRWTGNGSLTVNAIPVIYSGSSLGTVAAALGANGACPAVGAIGTATTATAGVYVITGALAGAQSAAACATTTPNLVNITATNASGDNLTLVATGVLNTQTGLRWDNVAPANVPAIVANPNGRTGGWLNDAVVFNAVNNPLVAATANNWISNAVPSVDAGVGLSGYAVRAAANTGGLVDAARTAADFTSAATLARSATGATYCAIAYAVDLVGNRTASPLAGQACGFTTQSIPFGVDRDPPVVAFGAGAGGGMAANFFGAALTNYRIVHYDTGLVGNSGFQGATAAQRATVAISRRTGNAAAAAFVPNASTIVTVVNVADTLVVDPSNAATDGYYTTTITVKDNAGNPAGSLSRVALRDATGPTLLVPTQSNIALAGGVSQTFTSTGTDGNDLASVTGTVPYASVASGPFFVGSTTINTYNNLPAVTSSSISLTIPFFVRGMQTIGAGGAVPDSTTVNAMVAPGNLTMTLADMGANVAAQAYAMQNVAAFTAYTGAQISKLWMSGTGSISNGTGASANPTSRTFVLNQNGPITATPLFTRVELFRFNATVGAYQSAGVTTSPSSIVDNGAVRTTSWSVSFTPGTAWGSGAQNMLMVGYNANGDAVTIFTPIAVTITNP